MNRIQKKLLNMAITAAKYSYSPYSKFRVGAAVYSNGKVYTGTNIENASYSLSVCAERVAIANAISNGANNISGIAIACIDTKGKIHNKDLMPCGSCRQWISELAKDAWILIMGKKRIYSIRDLLPNAFSLID